MMQASTDVFPGESEAFDATVAKFAFACAGQIERDRHSLRHAVRGNEIQARPK